MFILEIVFAFLFGLIAANAVPHFVKGIMGQYHATPFARPSTPVANVWWAWLNIIIAIIFGHLAVHFALRTAHPRIGWLFVLFGGILMSVFLASHWTKHPEDNIKK